MESRVSNLETKFDDFKTSQSSRSLLGVVDSHERAMESRVKNAETTLAELQKEIKSNNELILQMLQSLAVRVGVGSSSGDNSSKGTHTDTKIREGLNPNLGPNFGRPDSCRNSHPPFIKMASHISVLKSDEIVLKLQSFHNEKIQAREKVDEFLSQYRPKYKPKSPPCLRPTLKKFKRVRDYAKFHEDGSARFRSNSKFQVSSGFFRSDLAGKNEKVFDLLDKKVEDSVIISLVLDSDCMKSKIQACILGSSVPNGLVTAFRDKFDQFRTLPLSNRESNCKNDLAQEFIFIFSVSDDGFVKNVSLVLQVFDERLHSTNNCVLQLGYHMPVSDSGGGFVGLYLFMKAQPSILENACQKEWVGMSAHHVFVGMQQTVKIVSLKLGFHELILDKGGTTIQRLLNSKFTGTVETILVQENASAQLFDALQFLGGFYNDAIVVVGFEFYYLMGIRDKGGGYLILSEYTMVLRFVRTKVANDLIIQVGDSNFYLYKLPMVMRSGHLNRLVFQRISVGRDASPRIQRDNLPGGAKVFESVVKICYGWTVDLTTANIALLYCAAHFLEMTDDFKQGNLISKTETFLSFLIFSSWKDTFRILRGCESISLCAKELKISTTLNAFSFETDDIQCFNVLPNNAAHRINHFIEVIQALNCKGLRADLIGSCIAHWTVKWLSRVTSGLGRRFPKHMTHQFLRVTTECLVKDVVDGGYLFDTALHM